MSINRFVNNHSKVKPFHSSGYAQVAHGDAIGSTSKETFNERLAVNKNRTAIRKYRESLIVRGHHGRNHNRSSVGTVPAFPDAPSRQALRVESRQDVARAVPQPQKRTATYVEPPARGYDPFA